MTPMHQPVKTNKVYHNLKDDGNDIELTKFVEWVEYTWLPNHQTTLNISSMMWDNGHDVLRFETNCDIIQLTAHIRNMSLEFGNMFIMYDFYTGDDEEKYQEGVMWFYNGQEQNRPE